MTPKGFFGLSRKILLSVICCVVLFSLVAFRHVIFQISVEFVLGVKFPVSAGWYFEYEKVDVHRDRVVFDKVLLKDRGGSVHCAIERIDFFAKHRKGLSFDTKFHVEKPVITLVKNQEALSATPNLALWKPSSRIDIQNASLELIDGKEMTKVFFSLVSDEERRSIGTFYLSEGVESKGGSEVMMKLYKWPQESILKLEMKEASLKWMAKIGSFFLFPEVPPWEVSKGALNGHFWLGVGRDNTIDQVTATLNLTNLLASNVQSGFEMEAEVFEFDFSYPGANKVSDEAKLWWWQNSALKSQMKGCRIAFKDDAAEQDFSFRELEGKIHFNSFKDSEVFLQGFLNHKGQSSPILFKGNPNVIDKDTLDIDMSFLLDPEISHSTHLNLSLAMRENKECILRGKLKDMGTEQIGMIQHVASFVFPTVKDFQLKRGFVNCEISLRLKEGKCEKLLLDHLIADDLELYWASQEVLGHFAHLSGSGQFDFQAFPELRFPSWEINLQNGDIVVAKEGQERISIADINMQLFMCRDVFEPSWIRATYGGIDVLCDILGYYPEANIKMHLSSSGDQMMRLLMGSSNEFNQFSRHKIHTDFEFRRQLDYWDVGGNLYLNVIDDWEDSAKFGFHLSDKVLEMRQNNLAEVVKASISKGWFQAPQISCEFIKFINCIAKTDWLIEGIASFDGTFNGKELEFDLDTSFVNFFSKHLDFRLNPSMEVNVPVKPSSGKFHFDLEKGVWQGFLPLYRSIVHEKTMDIFYQEVEADLYIQDTRIHLEKIKTQALGVHLEGEVEVDLSAPTGPLIDVVTSEVNGNSKDIQAFLKHIPDFSFKEIPIEGRIKSGEEGFLFKGDFRGEEPLLDWEAHFQFMHGSYKLPSGVVLSDISFDFDCEEKSHQAILTNVLAKCANGLSEEGYRLNAKYISLEKGENGVALSFDVRLENAMMDLVRLVGTYSSLDRLVKLDQEASHLFEMRLDKWELALNEAYEVHACQIEFTTLLEEAKNLVKIASEFQILEGIDANIPSLIDCKGEVKGKIALRDGNWNVAISGEKIDLGQFRTNNLDLLLKITPNTIDLEKLNVEGFSLSGSFLQRNEDYEIRDLRGECYQNKFAFKKGNFDRTKKKIVLPIEFIEGNLSNLGGIPGEIKAQGEVEIDFSLGLDKFLFLVKGSVQGQDIGKDHYAIDSLSPISLTYTMERGFVLQDSIFQLKKKEAEISFEIPTLAYDFRENLLQGFRIKTTYQEEDIKKFFQSPELSFFDVENLPINLNEATTILFDFDLSKEAFQIGGLIEEGNYRFRGKEVFLKGITFHYDQKRLDVFVHAPLFGEDLGVKIKVRPEGDFDTSIAAFQMIDNEICLDKKVFSTECQLKGEDGILLKKFEGNLFGLNFEFVPLNRIQESEDLVFLGEIKINAEELLPAVSGEIKNFITELKIKKGYELKGELTLPKSNWKGFSFDGYLNGRDFDFAGYLLKTLLASVHVDKEGIEFRNFSISDDAVNALIPEIKLACKEDQNWYLDIPELKITDLRPSLLKKRFQAHQRIKPFHIKTMEFHDITGRLDDTATLSGKGNLKFVNTFKQGNNLLDLPLEFISRLGLDMVLLVPIQGEMDYVLKEGKIVFTKLKNSYSESKRSYFYLWNKTESFIDFDGNIHIDIRMKQYVLFKITELFILSIQGNLEKPKFSLR